MAVNEIAFQVNLKKNMNTASRTYGQFFGEPETKKPLSLRGFAKHLTDHGKLTTYEMMVLVLQNIVSCMKELICQGQSVKLEGLGTFYPTIEGKGADSVEEYLPAVNIEGVHLRFLPEGEKDGNLTSRELKKACIFELKDLITVHVVQEGTRKKRYQTRVPISDLALYNQDQGGSGGGETPEP